MVKFIKLLKNNEPVRDKLYDILFNTLYRMLESLHKANIDLSIILCVHYGY